MRWASAFDERLCHVRLTVGEPTFVSVDNQVAEEWRTADSPHKRTGIRPGRPLEGGVGPAEAHPPRSGRWYPGEAVAALAGAL